MWHRLPFPPVRTDIEGLRNLKPFSMQKISQSDFACSQSDEDRAYQPVGSLMQYEDVVAKPYHVICPWATFLRVYELSLVAVLALIHLPAHPLFPIPWKAG